MNIRINKKSIVIIVIILIIAGTALTKIFAGSKNKDDKNLDKNIKLAVTIAPAKYAITSEIIKLTGTVLPMEEVKVYPKVSGNIISISADSGNIVSEGQLLAKIDDSDYQIQLQQAKARLEEAQSMVYVSKAGLDSAYSNLKIAESDLIKAENDKKRYEELVNQKAASPMDYDAKLNVYNIALSRKESAIAEVKRAEAEFNENDANSIAFTRVKQAQADLDAIKKKVNDCYIKAPVNGYVLKRNIKLGDRVSAEGITYIMAQNNNLELNANASETDIFKLKTGDKAEIYSNMDDKFKIIGTIRKIEPYINPQTRIGLIKIELPKSKNINYGMFLCCDILLKNSKKLVVPEESVMYKKNKYIVFTIDKNNIVHETEVQPGNRIDGKLEIREGLSENQNVVVDGAGFLYDGDKVSIKEANQ